MSSPDLAARYLAYLDRLNARAWDDLADFVGVDVRYNGEPVGLDRYRASRESERAAIPDLRFEARLLLVQGDTTASRLLFDCTPTGEFQGLPVNGRRVTFAEHAFYRWREGRIAEVWSVIDTDEIRRQLFL